MKTIDLKTLQEKREELIKERDTFLEQANRQMAAFEGAIRELDNLMALLLEEEGK